MVSSNDFLDVLKTVASTPEGRLTLGVIMEGADVLTMSTSLQHADLAYEAGKRDVGLGLYRWLEQIDCLLPVKCRSEYRDWQKRKDEE